MQGNDICRICSSPGEYDVFSSIPSYLHASPNEYLQWKKNINVLLEETTGLEITPEDGLPKKMCALCISYLKHAATFRQQAIDNAISLKVAQTLISSSSSSRIVISKSNSMSKIKDDCDDYMAVAVEDLNFKATRKTDTIRIINNVLGNPNKVEEYGKKLFFNNKNNTFFQQFNKKRDDNNLKMCLNDLYDKEANIKSKKFNKKRYYSNINTNNGYSNNSYGFIKTDESILFDKNFDNPRDDREFQESSSGDDTEFYDQDINFFDYKEKNFEEDDVMDLEILKDANIIMKIPQHFKERKCRACCRRFMSEESYTDHKNACIELKFLVLIEEINRLLDVRRTKTISPHEFIRRMIFSLKKTFQWLNSTDMNLLDKNDGCEQKNTIQTTVKDDTNEIVSNENVDTACSSNNNYKIFNMKNVDSPRIVLDSKIGDSRTTEKNLQDNEMVKAVQALELNQINLPHIALNRQLIKMKVSGRCNACNTSFESIGALEKHNLQFHNLDYSKYEQHKNIIDLFEGSNDIIEGTVDLKNIYSLGNTNTPNNSI